MSNAIIQTIIRLFFFVLIQAVVLQQIQLGGDSFNYISLFIYPLILVLLPLKTPKVTLVLIGFALGTIIDFAYQTPGVHAAASLFTVVLRPIALSIFAPREGYNVNLGLTARSYGMLWFLKYASALFFIHLLFYFSFEIFTPLKSGEILLRTIFSTFISMILVFVYMFLFRPKD